MIRRVLALCTGVVLTACIGCAPAATAEQSAAPGFSIGRPLANCQINDPGAFPSAVTMLAPGYDPSGLKPPVITSPPPSLTPQMQSDLIAAFTAAPPLFRAILCRLDGIYVDPSASSSWAFRDPVTLKRYIGLSAGLWGSSGTSSPDPYHTYETKVLAQVMSQLGMGWPTPSSTVPLAPAYAPAMSGSTPADSPAMTLVAVLAHEFGHVLWYEKVKALNGDHYNPNAFCQSSGTNFFTDSWQGQVQTPNPWVGFATGTPDQHVAGTVQIADLQAAMRQRQFATFGALVNQLYAPQSAANPSGVWPSLFGAIAPQEDFAEAVKLLVLTLPGTNQGHPITAMPLDIYTVPQLTNPTYAPDVFAGLSGSGRRVLARKIRCINDNSAS